MANRRHLLERMFRFGVPRPMADFAPPPREIAPGLWTIDRMLRLPGGLRLPCRTTLVRLRDGSLVVISPPAPVPTGSADELHELGPVRDVVAPNGFHYVYAEAFLRAHPKARLLAAPGLRARAPELPPSQELGPKPPPEWGGELELSIFGPVRSVSEALFFHTATGTLVLTDLAFNMRHFPSALQRMAWRLSGVPDRFGPSRTARLLLLRDRETARRCLERAAQWPIRRIVVAHGDPIEDDAQAEFRRGFARYLAPGAP